MLYHLFDWWLRDRPTAPFRTYAYQSVPFRAIVAILVSFVIVWWGTPRVIRVLVRLKVGDNPEFDNVTLNEMAKHKAHTPTMGGVIVVAAIVGTVLLLADLTNYYVQMGLFGLLWLTAVGGVDDWLKLTAVRRGGSRNGLKMHEKLLFQVALGVLLGYSLYRYGSANFVSYSQLVGPGDPIPAFRILSVPFYKHGILLGIPASMIVSVLVIAGTSNAVNLTDGMDGLAAGSVALCSFVFLVLTYLVGTERWATSLLLPHVPLTAELALLCGAITGACLGFLWYNCHPAQIFMGDTGSLPLGGLIGFIALAARQELMLLIVGGLFVIEALSVILQVGYFKFTGGKRIFRMAPIHHHFHLGGWTETQTVVRFWLLAALFAAFALVTIKLR